MEAAIDTLLNNGALGVIAAIFIYLYVKKDQQYTESERGRLADEKAHAEAYQTMNEKNIEAKIAQTNMMITTLETVKNLAAKK